MQEISANLRLELEQLLGDVERRYSVHITIHDLKGVLADGSGRPLLSGRNVHPSPYCQLGRSVDPVPGWGRRCSEYCHLWMNDFMKARRERHVGICWKGVVEIVLPLRQYGTNVAILFAGAFRSAAGQHRPAGRGFPDCVRRMYADLPVLDPATAGELTRVLTYLGQGMLARIEEELVPVDVDDSRQSTILRFVRRRFSASPTLQELAGELCLSPSRTSHLVRELFGRSFQRLLLDERMRRARVLLAGSPQTLEQIAGNLGYSNGYYFNRVFRQYFGTPPGRYRKSHAGR